MKLKMSENLRKQVEGQEKLSGSNHSFVLNVRKMMAKDFKTMAEAEKFADQETGLGRTILYGGMGLVKA